MSGLRLFQAMAGAAHGGAEAFFGRLALALARAGQDQEVAIRREPARAAMLRAGGVRVHELRFGGRLDFGTRPALKRLLRAYRPDVALCWMSRASAILPPGPYRKVARLGGYYDLKYYRDCDHLIGNTPDIVRYLIGAGWPEDRAHYLPNFVDETAAAPVPRASLSTPEGAPLILALGRLHRNKGFDVLIAALAQMPGVHLWLAGEGPERGDLEARIAAAGIGGRVHLLGWREDTAALLAAADLLVCPSRHEPLGNVVLEGWAHRRPVVASDSQGPRQLLRDRETGMLVPMEDADALARALSEVIADPGLGAALAAAGRAAFEAEYAEAAVVRQYRDFFERIAA